MTGSGRRREHAASPGSSPSAGTQARSPVVVDGGLDGEQARGTCSRGHHREPRSCRARARSASRAPSLSPFKAPKFAFDSGLCSKLRSSNARWWRASASAASSDVSGRVGAFTGSCSWARTRFRSGRDLPGRRGAPEPASPGRPRFCCAPAWGCRGAWPGWDDRGERSGRLGLGSTGRSPRVARRSLDASGADGDNSACWEGSGACDARSVRASWREARAVSRSACFLASTMARRRASSTPAASRCSAATSPTGWPSRSTRVAPSATRALR